MMVEIERAHRTGKACKPGHVIFELLRFQDKLEISRKKPAEKLKETGQKIKEGLTGLDKEKLRSFQPSIEQAIARKERRNLQLIIGQKVFHNPPFDLESPGDLNEIEQSQNSQDHAKHPQRKRL